MLVDSLVAAGVPIGVASSSSLEWLDRHLGRLGLRSRFAAVIGADLVGGVGKPAPDVYLRACADLGADPAQSVALEDSAHGVASAKAAGMAAVAVPSRITRFNDFTHADLVVDSRRRPRPHRARTAGRPDLHPLSLCRLPRAERGLATRAARLGPPVA